MEPATKLPLAVDPGRKFVPVTEMVKALAPTDAVFGLSVVIAGALTVNTLAAEVTVPVFLTVTLSAPAAVSAVAGTVAVRVVAVPVSAVKAFAPRYTVDPATKLPLAEDPARKFVPVTVRVNALAPTGAVFGLSVVIAGPLTVIGLEAETDVLEFFTVTLSARAPAAVMALDGTVAVMTVVVPVSTVKAFASR